MGGFPGQRQQEGDRPEVTQLWPHQQRFPVHIYQVWSNMADLISLHLYALSQPPRYWRCSRRVEGRRQTQSQDCGNQEKWMRILCFLIDLYNSS